MYTLIDHKKKKLTKYIDCYSFFNSTNRYFRCIALHFQLLEYKTKIDSCKVNGYTRIAICNNNSSMTSLLMHTVAHFIRHSFKPKTNNLLIRKFSSLEQRYTYRVVQTIQMKLILLCVWAEVAVLGSTITALKFKYEI